MKLDEAVLKHLQQLDIERGSGVTVESARINTIDKPILIVGLGGTGIEALIRAKKMINKRFKLAKKQDKPSNVEFLAIDTDDNNSYINYHGIEFSRENKEFALLDNSKLTSIYKSRDVILNDNTKWLSNSLRLQQVKHGAGGIRQAGRLMLFINIDYIISIISEKIHKLILNRSTNGSIYVFILAGLSGGTGSGCFIDIAYLIRMLAEQKGFNTENIGMLFLPDVTLTNNFIDPSASQNIKANGFAAFKELDFLMNIEFNGETFTQAYSGLKVNSKEPPFDLCNLISSKDQNCKIVSGAKEYCMSVVSETIINFIASEVVSSGQNYTLTSYLSNIENNKTTFITNLKTKYPVNYIYNIVGASSFVLSVENISNYLVSVLFSEVNSLHKNDPSETEISETMYKSGLELEYLVRYMQLNLPPNNDLSAFNYHVINQRPNIIDDAVKADYMKIVEHFNTKRLEFVEDQFTESIETLLNEHFCSIDKGPFYVTKEVNDIINKINAIREKVIPAKRISDFDIQGAKTESDTHKSKMLKGGIALDKNRQINKYKDSCRHYYQLLVRNDMYRHIDKLYESVTAKLTLLNDKFDTLRELISKLKELFDKAKVLVNRPNATKSGFGVDLFDTKEFIDMIMSGSARDFSLELDFKSTLKSFLKEIITNYNEWLDPSNPNIAGNISKFISSSFDNVLNRSMDFYLNIIAQTKGIDYDKYIDMKISELKAMSTVMFPMSNLPAALGINFPPYSYLAVPSNSPLLKQKCEAAFAHGLSGNLKISNMSNRMFMLNLNIGVPFFCYSELVDYEKAYEMARQTLIPGIHLYESEENNWKDLPSPNYEKLWVNGYENKRELAVTKRIYEVFDKAKKYGYIKWDDKRASYKCTYGDILDIEALLSRYEVDLTINAIYSQNSRLLMNELKAYLQDESRLIYTSYLYDADINDDEFSKGIFLQMHKLNSDIGKQVNAHEVIMEIIRKLSLLDEEELSYSNFAKIIYTGCLYRVRKNYKYVDSKGVEQTIYTIDNLKNNFEEYNLFTAFGNLSKDDLAYLQKTSTDIENNCDDIELKKIIDTIDSIRSEYNNKYSLISNQINIVEDGKIKAEFYKAMIEVFENSGELLL